MSSSIYSKEKKSKLQNNVYNTALHVRKDKNAYTPTYTCIFAYICIYKREHWKNTVGTNKSTYLRHETSLSIFLYHFNFLRYYRKNKYNFKFFFKERKPCGELRSSMKKGRKREKGPDPKPKDQHSTGSGSGTNKRHKKQQVRER